MTDKPQMNPRIQENGSVLFDTQDGITVRVVIQAPTQVRAEMWRDADNAIMPPDVGNIGMKSFREKLAKSAHEVFNPPPAKGEEKNKETVPNLDEDLGSIATVLLGVPDLEELLKPAAATSTVDRLVELVENTGTLFSTPSGRSHVSIEVEGHTETYALDDAPFIDFLRGHFYKTERERLEREAEERYERLLENLGGMVPDSMIHVPRPAVLKEQAISDAINQLKSIAMVDKKVEEVFLRVAGDRETGKFYLDLCDDDWRAVEVDEDGWRVVSNPPLRFVRAKGQLPLPAPEMGGSVGDLKELLNIGEDEDSKRNWPLLLVWLVQALRPNPQHPILALKGGEGTAKSFTAFLLRSLVDPHDSPDDYTPPDLRTLCIWAEHEWVIALDNISSMPEWLSNALCKLVTGMGFKVRTLYKDRGLEIFKARRPITINGIADIGTNKDLMSRTLLVNLPVISKYQLEREIMESFEEKRPGILGALLEAVSAGMRKLPELKVEGRGSRMPDFDLWGRATEVALGFTEGTFLKARGQAEREATQSSLEAEPIAITIERFAGRYTRANLWEGEAQELLDEINELETDDARKRDRDWPKSPGGLGKKLSKLQSSLRTEGVIVEKIPKGAHGKRGWRLFYEDPGDGGPGGPGGTSEEPTTQSATQSATQENPIDKPETATGGTSGTCGASKSDSLDEDYIDLMNNPSPYDPDVNDSLKDDEEGEV